MADPNGVQLEDRTNDRKYFTMLPNVLWEMGLSCYDLALYAYVKRVAGEAGICWHSMRDLAKQTGMSLSAIDDSRKTLEAKGLITCTKRKHNETGWAGWHISIVDVWQKNMETMTQKCYQDKQSEVLPPVTDTAKVLPPVTDTAKVLPPVTDTAQKCSQDARKEEPYKNKKNQREEERESAPEIDHEVITPPERKRHSLSPGPEPSEAVKAYLMTCNEFAKPQYATGPIRTAIDASVLPEDIPKWQATVRDWLLAGYRAENIAGMLDVYKTGGNNGRRGTNQRGSTNDVIKTTSRYVADA
jgi:hypothetical protein